MDTSVFVPGRESLVSLARSSSASEIAYLAQQCLRLGDPTGARALCEAAREAGLAEPMLALSEATAQFACKQPAEALALVDGVLAVFPEHLSARYLKALMLGATGRVDEGRELLVGVIHQYPEYPGALSTLSAWLLPGLYYRDALVHVHAATRPRTYLEIGVETGATLALAKTAVRAVGVDPVAARVAQPLGDNARLFPLESDAFFARESVESVFDGMPVELTFIDGMHWFEYALRDFANAERWSSPDGAIVLHDCLPVAPVTAERERATMFWVGDTWKTLEALLDYRPDLRISVIAAPPSGLVVVRGLSPTSTVLSDAMPEIVERYKDLEYPHTPGSWPERYRLTASSEAGIAQALGA
jgi:hypothetical protein